MIRKSLIKILLAASITVTTLLLLSVISFAAETWTTVDDFETHNWHSPQWSDQGTVSYSSDWHTQGNNSLQMDVANGLNWCPLITGTFDTETPDQIMFDVKAGQYNNFMLSVEIIDSGNVSHRIAYFNVDARQILTDVTCDFNGYDMKQLRFIVSHMGPTTINLDNIRLVKNGVTTLWDPCESHFYWDGSADADNGDGEVARSDDLSKTVYSPNNGSTASQVMEWDSSVNPDVDTAETVLKYSGLNVSSDWYLKFDVYRPSGTPNVNLLVYLYDGAVGSGTVSVKVDAPDQWTTVKVPLFESIDMSHITEIHFVVQQTDVYPTGRLYFDNLQIGGYLPEPTPVDLTALGYPHVVKDFNNGLFGNGFCGNSGTGTGSGGIITDQLSETDYNSPSGALKLGYDLNAADSYIFYVNALNMNSVKDKISLYLKSDAAGPGRVKLEFHDKNWSSSGCTNGCGYCYLSGMDTSWKQWIVPVNPDNLDLIGSLDTSNITEVVVSLDKHAARDKTGAFYVDDITFVDSTDALTPYPGLTLPEATPVDLNTLGYSHVVKNFSDGLYGNGFHGTVMTGSGTGGALSEQLSETDCYTAPGALRIDYDVSADDSYIFYCNTLNLNSVKNKLALYLKEGDAGPGCVKLELHDKTWATSGGKSGCGYSYLYGVDTSWKQWIVSVDPAKLAIIGSLDTSNITEVVLSFDKRTVRDKTGTLYVDDITFVDSTDTLTPYPGLTLPDTDPANDDVRQIGVPYLLDDYDGRILDSQGQVTGLGFTEFFGYSGTGSGGGTGITANNAISHVPYGGIAHSTPNACKIDYGFTPGQTDSYIFYYNLLYTNGARLSYSDMSFADKFSVWLKGGASGNPYKVKVEFHDLNWGLGGNYSTGCAYSYLDGVSADQWTQFIVSTKPEDLITIGNIDFSKLKEVVLSFDYRMAKDKSGSLYIDDLQFIDTDQKFTAAQDFTSDSFLNLVEKRTFQYFLDAYNGTTGLVLDRINFTDMATTAGTGFGLTGMTIAVERGWISRAEAEDYVLKVLTNLSSTPQGAAASGVSGYQGFFYHFLEAGTGLRKIPEPQYGNVELSVVDTALLMAGVVTCREYFSDNPQIVSLADSLYNRVNWGWFLDTTGTPATNPHYNQFYLGWTPEEGFVGHWDYSSDENILIDLLAIGSPTHPVSSDVFYAWARNARTYNGHNLIVSYNGSMFQYFFANCWLDLYGKKDAQGVSWWNNSVQAGLANRDFCIAGVDGTGRTNVSTYSADSWGLTACEGIPSGLEDVYLGGNGARPNGPIDVYDQVAVQTDGTVPPYGGISMIGFSAHPEGIPVNYITDLMKNFYQNTQLWAGWYGFRDAYTDSNVMKSIDGKDAISLYPVYKAQYFSIDEGPMMIMLENYRTGLVWDYFMRNANVQAGMNAVFTDAGTPAAPTAANVKINKTVESMPVFVDNFDGASMAGTSWSAGAAGVYALSSANNVPGDVTNCLRVDYAKNDPNKTNPDVKYAGFTLNYNTPQNLSSYDCLNFKVYGDVDLVVSFEKSDGTIATQIRHILRGGGAWQEIVFDLSSVKANLNDVVKIVFQAAPGEYVASGTFYIEDLRLASKTVYDVTATGKPRVGDVLTANYTFSDTNGDREYGTTYRWLSSPSANGTYTVIPGAIAKTYTVSGSDLGRYLKCEVTPRSWTGPDGAATLSGPSTVVKPPIGTLTYTSRYNNTNIDGASAIRISPDGSHAYVVSALNSSVARFTRNASTGALAYISKYTSTTNIPGANNLTISSDGLFVYVTADGSTTSDVVAWFSRNPSTGALTYIGRYANVNINGANSVELSPGGDHAYVTGSAGNAVAWFTRNQSTGALTYVGRYSNANISGAADAAVSQDGNHVYVTANGADAVAWFTRNASTGVLTYVGRYANTNIDGAVGVALSADGNQAYVAAVNADAVAWLARNKTTGALVYVGRYNGANIDGATDVAVSSDGMNVYVSANVADAVAWFSRNLTDGSLAYMNRYANTNIDGAKGFALSPNSANAYIAAYNVDAAAWFARECQAPAANNPPVLNPIGTKTGTDGQTLTFTATATDADNNPLTYSCSNAPDSASINPVTGVFTWTNPVAGTYTGVRISVSDGIDSDYEDITISIQPPPSILVSDDFNDGNYNGWTVIRPWGVVNGELTVLSDGYSGARAYVNSGAGCNLYSIESDMYITTHIGLTRASRLIYSKADSSMDYAVEFRAGTSNNITLYYNASTLATASFNIPSNAWFHAKVEVSMVNGSSSRVKVYVGSNLVIDQVVNELLLGLYTGLGTPDMPYTYSDWLKYDNFVVIYQAPAVDNPPVLNPIGSKSSIEGLTVKFKATASDIDNNPLTYSGSNLPSGAAINASTGDFEWRNAVAGTYPNVRIIVSDGTLTDYEDITITVQSAPAVLLSDDFNDGNDDGWTRNRPWGVVNSEYVVLSDGFAGARSYVNGNAGSTLYTLDTDMYLTTHYGTLRSRLIYNKANLNMDYAVEIRSGTTDNITLYFNGTASASASCSIPADSWVHVRAEVSRETSTSSRIKVYVNSDLIINQVVDELLTGAYTGLGTPDMPYTFSDWLRYDNFVVRNQP